MTEHRFTIQANGTIVLPDDDGEPAYYLQPADAFALETFIGEHRTAINEAASKTRTVQAYQFVTSLIAQGHAVPTYIRLNWDGKVHVEFRTVDAYDDWATLLGTYDDTRFDVEEHHALGTRNVAVTELLQVEAPWVAAEPVPA